MLILPCWVWKYLRVNVSSYPYSALDLGATNMMVRIMRESGVSWSVGGMLWAGLVVVIIPNALIAYFSLIYGLERPYLNVDYSVVLLLFVLNQRVLGILGLLVAFFFDLLSLVGQIFPVLKLSDVFYMAKFIGVAPASYQISGLLCLVYFFVLLAVFLLKINRTKKLEVLFFVNIVVFAYFYSAIFSESKEETKVWSNKERPVVSSQIIFGIDSRRTGFVESLSVDGELFGDVELPGATKTWFDDISSVDKKVLLIISESWGVMDEHVQEAILSPVMESNDRISDWKNGSVQFEGATVEAEIRELCQADLLHFNFSGNESKLSDCIPNKLRSNGYATFAFHGAAGLMYDRVKWYPYIGFDQATFFENKSWKRRCFSFPGACDSDIGEYVASSFDSSEKVFSYWLTLNTHHSYDIRDIHTKVLDCKSVGIPSETGICRNVKLHHQFFKNLAKLISKPSMAGVRVIVVGDHAPPIYNQKVRSEYFDAGKVPWVSFKVREPVEPVASM